MSTNDEKLAHIMDSFESQMALNREPCSKERPTKRFTYPQPVLLAMAASIKDSTPSAKSKKQVDSVWKSISARPRGDQTAETIHGYGQSSRKPRGGYQAADFPTLPSSRETARYEGLGGAHNPSFNDMASRTFTNQAASRELASPYGSREESGERLRDDKCLSCSYCGQRLANCLVKCMDADCEKWFCNGSSDNDGRSQKESHIITHLRASRHRKVGIIDQQTTHGRCELRLLTLHCAGPDCDEYDCLDMGMESAEDGQNPRSHFCRHCAIKLKRMTVNWRPFVDCHHSQLTCINETIVQVPSCGGMRMTPRQIAAKERSWLLKASNIVLPEMGKDGHAGVMNEFSTVKQYTDHFGRLIKLEESLAAMESSTLPALEDIKLLSHDTDSPCRWFEFETRSQIHKKMFRTGQPVVVTTVRGDRREKNPASIKANHETGNIATIRVNFSIEVGHVELKGATVSLEVKFQNVVYVRQLDAISRFRWLSDLLQAYIVGAPTEKGLLGLMEMEVKRPKSPSTLLEVPKRKLNSSQEEAVRMALSSPFSLIQGPPGTGKTHTIVALIYNILRKKPDAKILCCAPSNDPADHLAVQLHASGIDVIRVHSGRIKTDSMQRDLRVLTLRSQLEDMWGKDYDEKSPDYREIANKTREIIRSKQVVCTTCNTAVSHPLRGWPFESDYTVVIIDEATQATEADALIPITIAKTLDKVVLIGDQRQLGVTTTFRELENTNLGSSLFERLIRGGQVPSVMLSIQYRMHPVICEPASQIIYQGRLETGADVRAIREASGDVLTFLQAPPGPKDFTALVMIDISAAPDEIAPDAASKVNGHEATVVTLCLVNLLHRGIKPEDVGVITFYNGQKDILKKTINCHSCIPNQARKKLMIDSVDAFQGREKEFIILSCVRSGNKDTTTIGFLNDVRRLNVALTRAKRGIIIVGNRNLLETSDKWRSFLQYYSHVDELSALHKLGVSDVQHPNCVFCGDPSKRAESLGVLDDDDIADITRNIVDVVLSSGINRVQNVISSACSEIRAFTSSQKIRSVCCIIERYCRSRQTDRYSEGRQRGKSVLSALLLGLAETAALPVDILEESFGQQVALSKEQLQQIGPLYPTLIVDTLAPLVAAGHFPIRNLDQVFGRSTTDHLSQYQLAFQKWLSNPENVSSEEQRKLIEEASFEWLNTAAILHTAPGKYTGSLSKWSSERRSHEWPAVSASVHRRWFGRDGDYRSEVSSRSSGSPMMSDDEERPPSAASKFEQAAKELPQIMEDAWKPAYERQQKEIDQDEKTLAMVRELLNKITPNNYEKLSATMLTLPFTETPKLLSGAVDVIFEKAIDELDSRYAEIYAKLCRKLIDLETKEPDAKGKPVKFRTILLCRGQHYFEKTDKESEDAEVEDKEINAAETEEKRVKTKRQYLANIRFISELYRYEMLTDRVILSCFQRLLPKKTDFSDADEEKLECLCKLLQTCSQSIRPEHAPQVQMFFDQLKKMIDSKATSFRIRFLIQDTVDLKNNNFVRRKNVVPGNVKPKTQPAVAAAAAAAAAPKESKLPVVESGPTAALPDSLPTKDTQEPSKGTREPSEERRPEEVERRNSGQEQQNGGKKESSVVNGEEQPAAVNELDALEKAAEEKPALAGRLVYDRDALLALEKSIKDLKLSDKLKKQLDVIWRSSSPAGSGQDQGQGNQGGDQANNYTLIPPLQMQGGGGQGPKLGLDCRTGLQDWTA